MTFKCPVCKVIWTKTSNQSKRAPVRATCPDCRTVDPRKKVSK